MGILRAHTGANLTQTQILKTKYKLKFWNAILPMQLKTALQ